MPYTPNFAIPYQTMLGLFEQDPEGLVGEDGALAVDAGLSGLDLRIDTLEAAARFTRIAESILVGTAASVTFSSIPSTYRSLWLHVAGRSDTAATFTSGRIRFNSDSSAIYDGQQISGNATTAAAFEAINATGGDIGEFSAASATAGAVGVMSVFIPFYTGTTFWKSYTSSHQLSEGTGTGTLRSKHWAGRWRNTAAINSITVVPGAGNFIAGSSFVLYGTP